MQPVAAVNLSPWEPGFLSLVVYIFLVFLLMGSILFLTSWLGEKKKTVEKSRPYECGIIPTGSAHPRYPVPFYLVAVFFLIFDLEGAYIFAWAITYDTLGWTGWLQISFFIFVLLLGLIYLWQRGGLEWGSQTKPR